MARKRPTRTVRCPHCRRLADVPKGSPDCGRAECREATSNERRKAREQAITDEGLRAFAVLASGPAVDETPGAARAPEQTERRGLTETTAAGPVATDDADANRSRDTT